MPSDSPSLVAEASQIPPSDGGTATGPSSPAPQRRYETRKPPTTLGATTSRPESSVRCPPAKKVRTSGPSESSRASQLEPPTDFELPTDMSSEFIIRRPMLTTSPIEGNLDCKVRPFHSELYFDQKAMRQQLELQDSYDILQRYHLEYLMTPCEFFYPRVALDFYQSMTTRGVPSPTTIHFTIDGHHGILEARHIAEALQIPFKPEDLSATKGASTWDAPRRCGATFQPLSPTTFGTEARSYCGRFIPYIRGLLLWPAT